MLSYSNSNNFLSDWNGIRAYGNIPLCTLSFKLPAGETEFWIHINAHVEAHSDLPNNASETDPSTYNYALIDFMASQFTNVYTIRNHFYSGWDHPSPGAIKIKEICISYKPYYILLPDIR